MPYEILHFCTYGKCPNCKQNGISLYIDNKLKHIYCQGFCSICHTMFPFGYDYGYNEKEIINDYRIKKEGNSNGNKRK